KLILKCRVQPSNSPLTYGQLWADDSSLMPILRNESECITELIPALSKYRNCIVIWQADESVWPVVTIPLEKELDVQLSQGGSLASQIKYKYCTAKNEVIDTLLEVWNSFGYVKIYPVEDDVLMEIFGRLAIPVRLETHGSTVP